MKTWNRPRMPKDERGIALVKVLLLSTILVGLAAFGAMGTRLETRMSNNDMLTRRALAIAEAGLYHGFRLIVADMASCTAGCFNNELAAGGTGGGLTALSATTTDVDGDGSSFRTRSYDGGLYHVRLEDNYDEVPHDGTVDQDERVKIVSVGEIAGASRRLEVAIDPVPLFGHGLFARRRVRFQGGATTDSYDSSQGPYGGTNVYSNGDVGSNGNIELAGTPSTVNGDATAGGQVDPGTGTITGQQTENAPPVFLPPVQACNQTMGGYWDGSSPPIGGGNYTYRSNGNNAGTLQVNANENVVLSSGVYCFKEITLNGGSTLTVNGPVQIFLTDATDLSGGTVANTTQIPSNLQIYSSFVSTNDTQGLTLAGGAQAFMTVYAPNTSIRLTGNSHFFGAVVGDHVRVEGGASFHYDEQSAGLGSGAQLTNWHDVRY